MSIEKMWRTKSGKRFSLAIRSMVIQFGILAWCVRVCVYDVVWFVFWWCVAFDINTVVLFFTAIHLLPLFTYDFMMDKTAYVRIRFRLTKTVI